jgi:hypothetical protein
LPYQKNKKPNIMSEASENMFESMYQKFGANFFLACFVMSLMAISYLYYDAKSCDENTLLLEQKHSIEQAKAKDEFIEYLKNVEQKTKQIETESDEVENTALKNAKQIKQIKQNLE